MSVWSKIYERINWKDLPQRLTALAARNLNKMDLAIDTIDDRVIALDNGKVSSVTVTNTLPDGDTIATITVDGTPTAIKSKQQPNEQEMNVRSAMLLLSPAPIGENAPFVKRRSGGNVPFPALLKDKIIGASIVWNQLIRNGNFANTSYWTTNNSSLSVSNNIGSFTATAQNGLIRATSDVINGHKYLYTAEIKITSGVAQLATEFGYVGTTQNNVFEKIGVVVSSTATKTSYYPRIIDTRASGWDEVQVKNVMCFDLTAMFGSTIADYVSNLESITAGSGIAWLKSYGFFLKDYYANSSNTIQSVSVSAKKYVGKNLLSATISALKTRNTYGTWSGNTYTFNGGVYTVNDDLSIFLSGTPSNNSYFFFPDLDISELKGTLTISGLQDTTRIIWNSCALYDSNYTLIAQLGSSNKNDITFNTNDYPNAKYLIVSFKRQSNNTAISGTVKMQLEFGSTATSYEPYKEWQTALDHTTLRGLFKLDANNNLYADGDIYPSSGNGEVKWGIYTFDGTESWSFTGAGSATRVISDMKALNANDKQGLCDKLVTASSVSGCIQFGSAQTTNAIFIIGARDDMGLDTQAKVQAFTQGMTIIYPLATPNTQNLTPYPDLQNIENGGTEEFVDYGVSQGTRDVAIPVGGDRQYYQGMDLPALPTASGNHNLQFNPSSGFSWS